MAFSSQVMMALYNGQVCVSGDMSHGRGLWKPWHTVGGKVTEMRTWDFVRSIFLPEVVRDEKDVITLCINKWLSDRKYAEYIFGELAIDKMTKM